MPKLEALRPGARERAVHLEACGDGINPKTRVRSMLWERGAYREVEEIFDTLEEALAYAQALRPDA